ncbi:MAG: hypothetical protein ACPGU4_04400 [Flavobacteriales bacterium]
MKRELDFGIIELSEDGILRFKACPSLSTISLSQLKEMLEVLVEVSDGKPRPFFSDNSNMKSLGHVERKFIGNNLHRFALASAVKETSLMVRSIGFAINHLFPPKVPMQMFNSEEDAIAWLMSFRK